MADDKVLGGSKSNHPNTGTASSSPHVARAENPDAGPLKYALEGQMTIEMGALPTKDPQPGF